MKPRPCLWSPRTASPARGEDRARPDRVGGWRQSGLGWGLGLALLVMGVGGGGLRAADPDWEGGRVTADDFYNSRRVWSAEFTLAPEQWAALLRDDRAGGEFGNLASATSLSLVWMQQGDGDRDGRLSSAEFRNLATNWYGAWDTGRRGQLSPAELEAGWVLVFGRLAELGTGYGSTDPLFVHGNLALDRRSFTNVGVRVKGGPGQPQSSFEWRRSLKVDLNQFVLGQRFAGLNQLNFHSAAADPSRLAEALAYRFYREAGVPAPRTTFARVEVQVSGRGQIQQHVAGLYPVVEDVGNRFLKERLGSSKGSLFKSEAPQVFTELGPDWQSFRLAYAGRGEVNDAGRYRVLEFSRLVSRADDIEFARRVPEFLELDAFARFLAVTVLLSDVHSVFGPGGNCYVYAHPESERFWFLPWDPDRAWGRADLPVPLLEELSLERPWAGENRFLERLFRVAEFKSLYRARLEEFTETLFIPARLEAQIDELVALVRPAVANEPVSRRKAFEAAVGPPGAASEAGTERTLRGFIAARSVSIRDQLAGRSRGRSPDQIVLARGRVGEPWSAAVFAACDQDRDGLVSPAEFVRSWETWFQRWDTTTRGSLDSIRLREGIRRDLLPPRSSMSPERSAGGL